MRKVALLEPKELEEIAWRAFEKSGLPKPRGVIAIEQNDSEGEDIIIVGLQVTKDDNLGTSAQRLEAGRLIQHDVWDKGDNRGAIMRHVLVDDQVDPRIVAA